MTRQHDRRHLLSALAIALSSGACTDDTTTAMADGSDGAPAEGSSSTAPSDASSGDADASSDDGGSTGEDETPQIVPLSPTEQLVRVSMALRGTRPSPDELTAVAADPDALASYVDTYLASPDFGETIRELHDDAWLVGSENPFPQLDPLADRFATEIGRAVSQSPLRLAEFIVTHDRPYTELVTADYLVLDEIGASVWGVAFDPSGDALQQTPLLEGVPAAGVLSDPELFVRHRSDAANYNRGRANMVSSSLLCTNFLDRDIEVDGTVDLADPDAVSEAVRTNPACASCHQTLDGLASFMWGWRGLLNPGLSTEYPLLMWGPNLVDDWEQKTGRPPNYFGTDGTDLASLGQLIADDPRFSLCTAQRFYAFFHQVPLAEVPLERAAELQTILIDSGFSAKAVVRAIVLDDEFLRSHTDDAALAEDVRGLKKARPSQLARTFAASTGFVWQTNLDMPPFPEPKYMGDIDLLRGTQYGFAVLGGGIDGRFVETAADTVNATTSLMVRQLAQQAAAHVVASDFAEPDHAQRRLLDGVGPSDSDEATIVAQLVVLHAKLYGELVLADNPSVRDAWTLWSAGADDPTRAWVVTLAAMLQDHRILFY
ncbi:MAG TPA: hypothetical protein VG755_28390 [Nannocystaceae bacterium]|nr:hypothetical protein [Nannocystaceae bacterium]